MCWDFFKNVYMFWTIPLQYCIGKALDICSWFFTGKNEGYKFYWSSQSPFQFIPLPPADHQKSNSYSTPFFSFRPDGINIFRFKFNTLIWNSGGAGTKNQVSKKVGVSRLWLQLATKEGVFRPTELATEIIAPWINAKLWELCCGK